MLNLNLLRTTLETQVCAQNSIELTYTIDRAIEFVSVIVSGVLIETLLTWNNRCSMVAMIRLRQLRVSRSLR